MISIRAKTILSIIFISLALIFAGELLNTQSEAHAESGEQCADQGFRNWNGWWWYSDGIDCWCNERENVSNPCGTSPVEG